MQVDFSGNGVVSILDASKLQEKLKPPHPRKKPGAGGQGRALAKRF